MHAAVALPLALILAALPTDSDVLPPIQGAHYPALSPDASRVVFAYQGDLFVADRADGIGRRITSHDAYDCRPAWSPDGEFIAFTSDRYGNYDVFVTPADGGEIVRLTYHSANDFVRGWSADGTKLLIASHRETRFPCAYSLDLDTSRMIRPMEDVSPITPDAFMPNGVDFIASRNGMEWWRIGYRGSTNADLFLYDAAADELRRLTDFDGEDRWAMVSPDGSTVYFVSERAGRPNLFALDLATRETRQLTDLGGDGVTWPKLSQDGTTIAFEHDFGIWTVRTEGGDPERLDLRVPLDYRRNFDDHRAFTTGVDELEVAPNGEYVAVGVGGDILLLRPEFQNDCIRLTDHPGDDSDFVWSPDSKSLVFTSDRTGNSDLFVVDVETREIRQLTDTPEYEHGPKYGPDGERIFFTRFWGDGVYSIPAQGGEVEQLEFDRWGLVSDLQFSPCKQWLLSAQHDSHGNADLCVMPSSGGEVVNITRHPGHNGEGRWDPKGEFIYFTTNRDGQNDIYRVRLTRDPAKFTDYKAQEEKKEEPKEPEEPAPAEDEVTEEVPPERTAIDFEDIHLRAERLTRTGESEGNLLVTPKGDALIYTVSSGGRPQVWRMDPDGENAKQLVQADISAASLCLTEDGERLFYRGNGRAYFAPGKGGDATEVAFRFERDEDARVTQIAAFKQAWSILNEAFYDSAFHGADWPAVRDRFAAIIDGTLVAEDFNQAISRMCGELNASHLGCWGGGRSGPGTAELGLLFDQTYAGPGLLVADVIPDGPCTEAGSEVTVGELILKIDDENVTFEERMFERLLDKAGKRVKLTVATAPDAEETREVFVKPVSGGQYHNLLYERTVKNNRERVLERSDGRLYYLHIRGMDGPSLERFRREMWADARQYEGVVLDVRYNGGGNTHDALFAELDKKPHATKSLRHGVTVSQPVDSFGGVLALLINEHSFSDAEAFPSSFRTKGLGPLIGNTTAGGVIWTYGRTLVNGHGFRLPAWEWRTSEGERLENAGVQPDIRAPYPYEAFRDGVDPQLDAAVDELLRLLDAQ